MEIHFTFNFKDNFYTFYERSSVRPGCFDPVKVPVGSFIVEFMSLDLEILYSDIKRIYERFGIRNYNVIKKQCPYSYLLIFHDLLGYYQGGKISLEQTFKNMKFEYDKFRNDILHFLNTGQFPTSEDEIEDGFDEFNLQEIKVQFFPASAPGIPFYSNYTVSNYFSMICLDISNTYSKNISIKQCVNCGRFFIPSKRSDEIYCDRINENGRTCKDVGYSSKIKEDPFKNIFTTARKTQHARIRYNKHIKDYKEKHYEPWFQAATQARDKYKAAGDIDGFKEWIELNKNAF